MKEIDEFVNIDKMGIKASGLEEKEICECLNCEKQDCNGCPKTRTEANRKYYASKGRRTGMGGCIYCGGKTIATKTQTINNGVVLRKKQCKVCGKMFLSAEEPVDYEKYLEILSKNK